LGPPLIKTGIVLFLRAMGFCRLTNGVMRIFTYQMNAHISKKALQNNIPILWWQSVSGGRCLKVEQDRSLSDNSMKELRRYPDEFSFGERPFPQIQQSKQEILSPLENPFVASNNL